MYLFLQIKDIFDLQQCCWLLWCQCAHPSSHSGGDQGLLNLYWGDWATKDIKYHLPFIYNVVPNVAYGYAPAFQR